MAALMVKDLNFGFERHREVLQGINLAIEESEIFCLIGPNGAGKSTLLKISCGLLPKQKGSISLLGFDDPRKCRSIIGYMAQTSKLYPKLTVKEYLLFFASLYAVKQKKDKIAGLIDDIGLTDKADFLTRNLSGGQRQRLALGVAMIHQPKMLFLDEPTVGIDPLSGEKFWELIQRIRDSGGTVLMTSHIEEDARQSNRIGVISEGELFFVGKMPPMKSLKDFLKEVISDENARSVCKGS